MQGGESTPNLELPATLVANRANNSSAILGSSILCVLLNVAKILDRPLEKFLWHLYHRFSSFFSLGTITVQSSYNVCQVEGKTTILPLVHLHCKVVFSVLYLPLFKGWGHV